MHADVLNTNPTHNPTKACLEKLDIMIKPLCCYRAHELLMNYHTP